uniref:Xylanolytic transcriptional activator regulatory domain-containing protein n=1 Tax=Bionectria ochroleuca TaxID=29856 RepID=A0A0B7KBD7_BIOOC
MTHDRKPFTTELKTVMIDCHTFLRRRFWRDLHGTYTNFQSYSANRNWLCRLSLILAIAEAGATNDSSIATAESLRDENTSATSESDERTPPALSSEIELFEQGLLMLKVSYEEPTVDDIEALNLASHCSYILNRRKSAYMDAGQSIRLARSLGLDRPAPSSLSNVEREHRKRVWWTAFCIDRSTSAELGLCPAYAHKADSLDLLDSSSLTAEEKEEFYLAELLNMQIKVCEMKSDVIETVSTLKDKDIERPYEIIRECLDRLNTGKSFPA